MQRKKTIIYHNTKFNQHIADLELTWSLNMELLISFLKPLVPHITDEELMNKSYSEESNRSLFCKSSPERILQLLLKIKLLFTQNLALRKQKQELRAMVLMDTQIMTENKRRIAQNNSYFNQIIDEISDIKENKDALIRHFDRKFIEVEVFARRTCKNLKREHPYSKYINFDVYQFLIKNSNLKKQKEKLILELQNLKRDFKIVKEENNVLHYKNNHNNYFNVEVKQCEKKILRKEDFNFENDLINDFIVNKGEIDCSDVISETNCSQINSQNEWEVSCI